MANLQVHDWYQSLVDDCRAILVERFYNSNLEAITAYGEVGERIYQDVNYNKFGKGNRGFNKKLFEDIRVGERTGYYCIQFYEKKLQPEINNSKFKDVCTAVQTMYPKNITWNKVRATLPETNVISPPPTAEQVAQYDKEIISGDCLFELPKIADKSIDMVYVDPPYNMNKGEWDTFSEEDFTKFTKAWLTEVWRVKKDKSHIFINFSSDRVAWLEMYIGNLFNCYPASRIIWHYRNAGGKSGGKMMFSKTYEPILHYNFGCKELNFPDEWNDERFDVWTIAVPQSNFTEGHDHPTQKPIELLERLVRFGSEVGEKVLDPMAGVGTTGVACKKLNRQFCLIEQNQDYTNKIYERLDELSK